MIEILSCIVLPSAVCGLLVYLVVSLLEGQRDA